MKALYLLAMFTTAALAQSATTAAPRVALVNIQDAILATSDGQAAAKQLDEQFSPRKAKLDEEQKAIAALQKQLDDGAALSDDERKSLTKDIEDKTVLLNVETDQDDTDLQAAQNQVLRNLGRKMVAVIVEYATTTGYAMVFDISTSQAPLLYAENATDITKQVIGAYEARKAQ